MTSLEGCNKLWVSFRNTPPPHLQQCRWLVTPKYFHTFYVEEKWKQMQIWVGVITNKEGETWRGAASGWEWLLEVGHSGIDAI